MIKLNLGSGENKLDEFVNIDAEPKTNPDVCLDFRYEPLPYAEGEVEEIWMLHCIEHIERRYWQGVFAEINRVLKPQGLFVLAYPEFRICADNFVKDHKGQREFWLATLYGRQLYPTDYHVTAVDTPELKTILEAYGFYRILYKPEFSEENHNTILIARKSPINLVVDREEIMNREFGLK